MLQQDLVAHNLASWHAAATDATRHCIRPALCNSPCVLAGALVLHYLLHLNATVCIAKPLLAETHVNAQRVGQQPITRARSERQTAVEVK